MHRTIIACVIVALALGGGTAVAASQIKSSDIKDGAVHKNDIANQAVTSKKIRNRNIQLNDITKQAIARLTKQILTVVQGDPGLRGPEGPQGAPGVANLEADGPYPGATDLGGLGTNGSEGDNSDATVPADGEPHAVWVQCPTGKSALGGGFRLAADAGTAAAAAMKVTASEPTQIENGAVVYKPIEGDAAGSFKPNGWLVEAINNGAAAVIVRPWVTCANVG